MKTMIAIPCMDMMPVPFVRSLLYLNKGDEDRVIMSSSSLIYDSRNQLLEKAIGYGFDRILWLDSDMDFPTFTMDLLHEDLNAGHEIVSGLYFKRRKPFSPVVFKECCLVEKDGAKVPTAECYADYPRDALFECAAFGFGCVMMTVDAAKRICDALGKWPFMPVSGFGEDMSFCMRARHVGIKLWCDSRLKVGHVGYKTFDENDFAGGEINA